MRVNALLVCFLSSVFKSVLTFEKLETISPPNFTSIHDDASTVTCPNTTRVKEAEREIHVANALSSSFEHLVGERLFVDKSLLIKEMFKVKQKVILLTRPPRWGKTITLDMIKKFLNLEVNDMGDRMSGNTLLHPKMFHGSNFDNPAVGYKRLRVSGSVICKKMCEYPVIYIDLAGIDGFNESDILWSLYDKIDHVFQTQFPSLNETSFMYALSEENEIKLRYERYTNRGTIEYGEFKKALGFLSSVLFKAYRTDPVILIDNYDKSLLNLYLKYGPEHQTSLTLRKALSDFLKKSLRHNPHLRKAFVTGVFPCAKYDIMGNIDLLDCNIFTSHFGRDFGFNELEILDLIGHMSSSKLEQVMSYYLGYSHGNQSRLANPYSIMNVLINKGALRTYWPKKDDVRVFNKALRIYYKHDYKTLMSGKSIPDIYLSQHLKLSEIFEPENLLEMLVYNGYLTATPSLVKVLPLKMKGVKSEKNGTVLQSITFHNVAVPNREILMAFHKVIRSETKRKMMHENVTKINTF